MSQNELEKTQLEIAKLQLEQERHKLGQLQERQRVIDDLSAGAVVVGGAAKKGVAWVAMALALSVAGSAVFLLVAATHVIMEKGLQAPYPGAPILEQIGYTLGGGHTILVWAGMLGLLWGPAALIYEGLRRR